MTRRGSPVIGVTADSAAANEIAAKGEPSFFLPHRYLRAVTEAGAVAVILPPIARSVAIRSALSVLDGLIITGGNFDIHPSYYGEKPINELGVVKASRTEFELEIAQTALRKDLPLLGLCGGEQALNVALGGSLFQDIAAQIPAAIEHEQSEKKSYGGHYVEIVPRTHLHEIVRHPRIEVNTSHHQAVKRLGKGLIIDAVADDGVIEGIESTSHSFALGVQWHPEVLAPKRQAHRRIFSAFIAACR
jgi:putative glutamine amidotransferase